ncbi:hypothetical protein B0H11DRAFT_2430613 [Mycena galericulata]|nr:hypothetical protein B0H11DRAFT_2430613 [Mycena galericulata]
MASTQGTPPSSESSPVLLDLTKVVSPLLFGSLFNFLSFGILVIQIYVYRACFPRDSLIIKFLVYFVFLVVLVCICLNASDMYYWFGSGYGHPERLVDLRYSIIYAPLLGAIISTLVQLFFCYRIFIIKRSVWPISMLISMISLAAFAGGVGGGIDALIEKYRVRGPESVILSYVWLVSGAAADIMIAVMMTYLLLRVSSAAHPSTRDVVKDVVTLIIETNTFSALVAVLSLGFFVGHGTLYYFSCPIIVLPGIYANTLLATFNNRAITSNKRSLTDRERNSDSTPFAAETALQSGFSAKQIIGPPLTRSTTAASIPAMSFTPMPEEDLLRERAPRSVAPPEDFRQNRSSSEHTNSPDTDEVARLEDDECTFVIS